MAKEILMDKLSVMGSVVPKTELVLLSTKSGSRISYQNPVHVSLIPRPFQPPIFDHLHCVKTGGGRPRKLHAAKPHVFQPNITSHHSTRDEISKAFPLHFCILQVIQELEARTA